MRKPDEYRRSQHRAGCGVGAALWLLAAAGCVGCSRSALAPIGRSEAGSGSSDVTWNSESCRIVTLEGERSAVQVPGSLLLIFDRSGSMSELWDGQPRWQAAGMAVTRALMAQPSTLTVGAILFPSPREPGPDSASDSSLCRVGSIDAPDQIAFAPSPDFLGAFNGDAGAGRAPTYTPIVGGMTPLNEALTVARAALRSHVSRGITTIVIITDGEPNCEWNHDHAMDLVARWRSDGIRTYVVGLPGVKRHARTTLDELAATGGTDTYSTPDDAAAIEQRIGEILVANISAGFDTCTFGLSPAARMPSDFHVLVSERGEERVVARVDERGEPAWSVAADGSSVRLAGETCAAAMNGAYRSIRLEFDCEVDGAASPDAVR